MKLDAQTLYTVLIAAYVLLGIAMLYTFRRPFDDGEEVWTGSLFVGAVALVLLITRGTLPNLISVVLANVLISVQYSLQYWALCRFFKQPPSRLWLYAPGIIAVFAFTIPGPEQEAARLFASGLLVGLQHVPMFLLVLVDRKTSIRGPRDLLLLAITINGGHFFVRALAALVAPESTPSIFGPIHASTLLLAVIYIVLATFSMVILFRERIEGRLRASRHLFESIIEGTSDAIFTKDREGRYQLVNRAAQRFLNLPPERIIGHDDRSLFPANTAERVMANDRAIMASGAITTTEVESDPIYGEKRIAQVVKGPLLDEQGKMAGTFGIARDVTDQKRAELALRQSEQRFSKTFNSAPVAASISQLKDGRFLEVNPRYEQDYGWTRADLIGKTSIEVGLWPDPAMRQAWADATRRNRRLIGYETAWRLKNGQQRTVMISSEIIEIDGNPCILAYLTDITERKQAEIALQQSEQRFAKTFNSAPIAASIARLDDGRFIEANPSYERDFGWTKADLIGKTSIEVGLWADNAMRQPWAETIQREGHLIGFETTWRHKNGELRNVSMAAVLTELDGTACILVYITDITERTQMAAQLQELNVRLEQRVRERTAELESTLQQLSQHQQDLIRSEAKATLSTLAASVSHELGTPIGNTVMAASTLSDLAEELQKAVDSGNLRRSDLSNFVSAVAEGTGLMRQNLARAGELIKDFRQVAADQASEQRRKFDLASVIEEVLHTLRPSLKRHPHRIDLDIPPGIAMDGLPGPLGQVVINLVNNAYLHAFEGRTDGVLKISAAVSNDEVLLRFSDNGCGIPAENIGKLFEPFFSTKIGNGGTGLGMAIVKNLVEESLGGSVAVASSDARGTSFAIRLPRSAPLGSA